MLRWGHSATAPIKSETRVRDGGSPNGLGDSFRSTAREAALLWLYLRNRRFTTSLIGSSGIRVARIMSIAEGCHSGIR